MGLESVTYISDLVTTWPLGTDRIRQGDDHFRNVKRALRNTFPNINGAVTVNQAALNSLPANFQSVLAELLEHVVPMGLIAPWSGSVGTIPVGWALCDGSTVVGFGVVPDLRERFIMGGGTTTPGTLGGSLAKTTSSDGGHTPVVQDTALTVAQMPGHAHRIWIAGSGFQGGGNQNAYTSLAANSPAYSNSVPGGSGGGNQLIEDTGGGQVHTHGADAVPAHTHNIADARPLFYTLAYIIKVTQYVAP